MSAAFELRTLHYRGRQSAACMENHPSKRNSIFSCQTQLSNEHGTTAMYCETDLALAASAENRGFAHASSSLES